MVGHLVPITWLDLYLIECQFSFLFILYFSKHKEL
uniref:Uncharacterized protein n=1 Tax=Arundo donax TaxID=35708 RepID=A0A0A9QHB8_ARUDO